jgi:hypothetical protein
VKPAAARVHHEVVPHDVLEALELDRLPAVLLEAQPFHDVIAAVAEDVEVHAHEEADDAAVAHGDAAAVEGVDAVRAGGDAGAEVVQAVPLQVDGDVVGGDLDGGPARLRRLEVRVQAIAARGGDGEGDGGDRGAGLGERRPRRSGERAGGQREANEESLMNHGCAPWMSRRRIGGDGVRHRCSSNRCASTEARLSAPDEAPGRHADAVLEAARSYVAFHFGPPPA